MLTCEGTAWALAFSGHNVLGFPDVKDVNFQALRML